MCGSVLNKLSRSLVYQSENNLFASRCFNNTRATFCIHCFVHVTLFENARTRALTHNEKTLNSIKITYRILRIYINRQEDDDVETNLYAHRTPAQTSLYYN